MTNKSLRDYINLIETAQQGVAEGLFGIDDKIKGRIQNIVSDLSDIPGMWNHEAETFTDAGMDKLKSVLKNNPKYIKYALNLTYRDYEAEGVAEEGYGTHPSQRVDPRTGKKYIPPKSPLGKGVAEGSEQDDPYKGTTPPNGKVAARNGHKLGKTYNNPHSPKYHKDSYAAWDRDYNNETSRLKNKGVAEGSDDNDTAKAAYMYGLRHGREGVGNNMDRAQAEWGDNFKYYNAGFLKGRNEKAKSLKAVGQGYSNKQQGVAESVTSINTDSI